MVIGAAVVLLEFDLIAFKYVTVGGSDGTAKNVELDEWDRLVRFEEPARPSSSVHRRLLLALWVGLCSVWDERSTFVIKLGSAKSNLMWLRWSGFLIDTGVDTLSSCESTGQVGRFGWMDVITLRASALAAVAEPPNTFFATSLSVSR